MSSFKIYVVNRVKYSLDYLSVARLSVPSCILEGKRVEEKQKNGNRPSNFNLFVFYFTVDSKEEA